MRTEVEAGRLLTCKRRIIPTLQARSPWHGCLRVGLPFGRRMSACRSGGHGLTEEFPAERLYRDAQIVKILAGSSQAQRLVVASEWSAGYAGGALR